MSADAHLLVDNVSKSFGATQVVKQATLSVGQGEFVSFLGPSGCGKTTILRMIAGFETPSAGRIIIDGRDVTDLKPNRRNIGMVFQSYALFPNMTVAGNIGFGLKVAGASRADIDARVKETLALIKLPDLADRFPWQLSGGQQQRVALARALAPRPSLLLLDEPLSALDAKIRVSLREEIRAIQRELGISTIFVTHDQEEALSMSDRVMVMNGGRIEQAGTPFEVYNRPATRFVANFVGTLSVIDAKIEDAVKGTLFLAGSKSPISGLTLPVGAAKDDRVSLALRPEALRIPAQKGDIKLDGKVTSVGFLGSVIRTAVETSGTTITLDAFNDPSTPPPSVGQKVSLGFAPSSALVLGQ